jgi:hypothetical protein
MKTLIRILLILAAALTVAGITVAIVERTGLGAISAGGFPNREGFRAEQFREEETAPPDFQEGEAPPREFERERERGGGLLGAREIARNLGIIGLLTVGVAAVTIMARRVRHFTRVRRSTSIP